MTASPVIQSSEWIHPLVYLETLLLDICITLTESIYYNIVYYMITFQNHSQLAALLSLTPWNYYKSTGILSKVYVLLEYLNRFLYNKWTLVI